MSVYRRHNAVVLTVRGELDASNTVHLASRILPFASTRHDLVLDLSSMTFVAAGGIQLLMAMAVRFRNESCPWALVTGPQLARVLRLTPHAAALPAVATVTEGISLTAEAGRQSRHIHVAG
ncbi:STAS domain-containing protein [Mycolicibacterium poriferae]|nr:STAS domain-containing protein [Mycolicibacterium poriferae]MCV7265789.1 STAS domain-containing protein [Mycolicibacterium poriferae]